MDRYRRTNPSVNRIITSRMQKRLHDILQEKIKHVKPTLDLRSETRLKRVRNRKKEQMDEDRRIVIDRDNRALLKRMEEIQLTPQMDCHLNRRNAQSNFGHRKLAIDHVNRENLLLLKRLQRAKSVYNSKKWEEEREDMLRRIRYMSEYKADGTPKFFQFGFEPAGAHGGTKSSKSLGGRMTASRRRKKRGTRRGAARASTAVPGRRRGGRGSRTRAGHGRRRDAKAATWSGTPSRKRSNKRAGKGVQLPRIASSKSKSNSAIETASHSDPPHSPIVSRSSSRAARLGDETLSPRSDPGAAADDVAGDAPATGEMAGDGAGASVAASATGEAASDDAPAGEATVGAGVSEPENEQEEEVEDVMSESVANDEAPSEEGWEDDDDA